MFLWKQSYFIDTKTLGLIYDDFEVKSGAFLLPVYLKSSLSLKFIFSPITTTESNHFKNVLLYLDLSETCGLFNTHRTLFSIYDSDIVMALASSHHVNQGSECY